MYRGSAGRSSTLRCKTRQKLTTSGLQNSSRSRCHPPSGSRAVFEPWTRIFDRENVPLRHTCRCRVSRRVRQLAPEDFFHPTAPDYRFGTTGRRAASFHACNLPGVLGCGSLIREKSRLAVYRRRLKSDITLAYEKIPRFRNSGNVEMCSRRCITDRTAALRGLVSTVSDGAVCYLIRLTSTELPCFRNSGNMEVCTRRFTRSSPRRRF